ncbi:hypothetical protein, conserved [Plasmodium gonderi]|uniref:Uncharacterized protein n=1 Tax=Plasmodium gonderi TaxID=77519 RepID=A0A1Y1JFQ1_PLAGO|nr:hypothetical protein, conserved [Plasmodium gonderi]GAW81316.1 hypothetical protein, conserved [Plasmodium gonderi]
MEMRKRKETNLARCEIYDYSTSSRKKYERKGKIGKIEKEVRIEECNNNGKSSSGRKKDGNSKSSLPIGDQKREDDRLRGETCQFTIFDEVIEDTLNAEMNNNFEEFLEKEKSKHKKWKKKEKHHMYDQKINLTNHGKKDSSKGYDNTINNVKNNLTDEVGFEKQVHYTHDNLLDVSTPNEEHDSDSLYEEPTYSRKKKNRKVRDNVKALIMKSEHTNEKRKKVKNEINDRIKNFTYEDNISNYDMDLFYYFSSLGNGKSTMYDGSVKTISSQNRKRGYAIIRSILDELIKISYEQGEKEKNIKVQKSTKCRNDFYTSATGVDIENKNSIRDKISFERIKNYDETNLRNMFFFENINIDFNGKKLAVSPFKSTIIDDIDAIDNNTKNSLIRKKNYCTKRKLKLRDHVNYSNILTYVWMEKLKIWVDCKNDNLLNSYVYINEYCISLNSEVTQFLYFLLFCNSLYADSEGVGKKTSKNARDKKGGDQIEGGEKEGCENYQEVEEEDEKDKEDNEDLVARDEQNRQGWHKQNDIDATVEGRNSKEPSAYFNLKKIVKNMELEMVKTVQEQNIFLSLCAPIIHLDFSSNINFVNCLRDTLDSLFPKGVTDVRNDYINGQRENSSTLHTRRGKKAQKEVKGRESEEKENGEVKNGKKENGEVKNGKKENGEVKNGKKENGEVKNGKKENGEELMLQELMKGLLTICEKMFEGNFLAISTCSYLNSYMFYSSSKRSRNFIFIYFLSQYYSKPIFFDIIEVSHICKKLEWIKFFDRVENGKENEETYIYLLLCQIGNDINIYSISKHNFFDKLYDSVMNEPNSLEPIDYIRQKIESKKFQKVFTYHNEQPLSDFSYCICINDNQRFLKIALTFNSTKIKVVSVYLREINKATKVNRFIEREQTTNASIHACADYLRSHFKDPPVEIIGQDNDLAVYYDMETEAVEVVEAEEEDLQTNAQRYAIVVNRYELNNLGETSYDVGFYEDVLYLQQGIISVCSFFPCLNSYLLCISTKEGEMIIIDIRNNRELYFFKRKTETMTHIKWHENGCISFGQEKGCIIHLFENKYFLNIDKPWNVETDIVCIHSSLINDMYLFLFDDGTVLKGKLKGNSSKVKISELFLWKTSNFQMDPDVLLSITSEECDEIESVSRILLYEYLWGLQNIFKNGIIIRRSKCLETNINKKTIALTPKCVSVANLDKNYLIAYGNGSGLIHLFLRKKIQDTNIKGG